jgi:hypothetical protein
LANENDYQFVDSVLTKMFNVTSSSGESFEMQFGVVKSPIPGVREFVHGNFTEEHEIYVVVGQSN